MRCRARDFNIHVWNLSRNLRVPEIAKLRFASMALRHAALSNVEGRTSKESFCVAQNEANHGTHSVFFHFCLIADG